MKKILCLLIIIVTIIVISLGHIVYGKVLVIENLDTKTKTELYLPNNSFSLGYIHSIMKTPAEEFFIVDENNQIVLQRTEYQSYGVGLPFLPEEGELKIVDNKFVLTMSRTFKEINMAVSPIPKHWLTIDNTKYDLIELIKEPNSLIKFYINSKIIFTK